MLPVIAHGKMKAERTKTMSEPILKIRDMNMVFAAGKQSIHAVNDVSFEVFQGETVGIVGESGCGKTTLGRCIIRAYKASSGSVMYRAADGNEYDLQNIDKKQLRNIRKEIQMVFQDPYSSLDPHMTVLDIVKEPLQANYKKMARSEMEDRVRDMAQKVGLNSNYLKRYPHAFSGGQRQRISIARALILYPRVVICDEAVSALDVSVQAQVINLLMDLQEEMGLSYIFISHDLSVVEHISDKVGVMYFGKMVEYANSSDIFQRPLHPYTEALLSAVPIADPTLASSRIPLDGDIPSSDNVPLGCFFHTRCRFCQDVCINKRPDMIEKAGGHYVSCHLSDELSLQGLS